MPTLPSSLRTQVILPIGVLAASLAVLSVSAALPPVRRRARIFARLDFFYQMSHPFPYGGAPTQQKTYFGGVATVAVLLAMGVYMWWYGAQTFGFEPSTIVYRTEPNNFQVRGGAVACVPKCEYRGGRHHSNVDIGEIRCTVRGSCGDE